MTRYLAVGCYLYFFLVDATFGTHAKSYLASYVGLNIIIVRHPYISVRGGESTLEHVIVRSASAVAAALKSVLSTETRLQIHDNFAIDDKRGSIICSPVPLLSLILWEDFLFNLDGYLAVSISMAFRVIAIVSYFFLAILSASKDEKVKYIAA